MTRGVHLAGNQGGFIGNSLLAVCARVVSLVVGEGFMSSVFEDGNVSVGVVGRREKVNFRCRFPIYSKVMYVRFIFCLFAFDAVH